MNYLAWAAAIAAGVALGTAFAPYVVPAMRSLARRRRQMLRVALWLAVVGIGIGGPLAAYSWWVFERRYRMTPAEVRAQAEYRAAVDALPDSVRARCRELGQDSARMRARGRSPTSFDAFIVTTDCEAKAAGLPVNGGRADAPAPPTA